MSLLAELGYAPDERVVVVHVDDLGMSRAANLGGVRALEGAATCGSIMVPCPAFDEMAQIARERPELDLGVHLTLNCEYDGHRWGPVRSDVPSLVAPDGDWEVEVRLPEDRLGHGVEAQRADKPQLDVTFATATEPVVLRASGTEPVIRVMVEGREESTTRAYADEIATAVRAAAV